MKKDNWTAVSKLENPCGLCYTANSASAPDVSAKCTVALEGSKMAISCRHLDGVARASVKKSAKHTPHNPQSTNVVVKCPECKEFKWSYFFKKHWDKHHRRSKGNMPGKLEEAIAVSAEERDYFQRGQKKLAKKRRSTGGAKGGSSKKKKGGDGGGGGGASAGGGAGAGAGAGGQ